MTTRTKWICLIGNMFEHYDNALFGLLAPFVSSLFFEKQDPVVALILTYGMLPLGILFRPLGALVFGWIGDNLGRKKALCLSLFGMALCTVMMGCLPTYATIGIWAPFLLVLCRIGQNFCASGENVGGSVFLLEHTQNHQKNFLSSIYNASTIVGTLIASTLVTLCSIHNQEMHCWRYLYWSGGLLALLILPLRYALVESREFTLHRTRVPFSFIPCLSKNLKPLLAIISVAGFSYVTYSLPFTFMNGYIPLVTSLTKAAAVNINTTLLLLDICTLPLFGYLASKYPKEKIMLYAAAFTFFSSCIFFYLLALPSAFILIGIRTLIVLCGAAFSATYYSWIQELVPTQHRYTVLSIGHAIGSQLIGAPTSALCLWLFHKTHWTGAPALYLMFTSLLAGLAIRALSPSRNKTACSKI